MAFSQRLNQRKLNLRSPLRSGRSRPRSPGPRGSPLRFGRLKAEVHWTSWVSAPLRSVQAEVPRTSWTLCARTVCPNQLEVVSLNSCKNKNTPSHMCEGVFLVVATRFELATSASRTQRSTKLSHATIINMNCVNIKIINKNPLIVKQKTNMIEEKVAKTIKPRN